MLVACRLAGLSALETYYAGVRAGAQFLAACGCAGCGWPSAAKAEGDDTRRHRPPPETPCISANCHKSLIYRLCPQPL